MSGPRRRKPADVRYYIDADVLGLAKILADLRPDVTYPGDPGAVVNGRSRPACPITTTDVEDTDWLPIVTAHGWAIITRDKRIERKPAERQAIIDHGARLFAITSTDQLTKWAQLEIVMSRWRDIELLARKPGPTMFALTYSGYRQVI